MGGGGGGRGREERLRACLFLVPDAPPRVVVDVRREWPHPLCRRAYKPPLVKGGAGACSGGVTAGSSVEGRPSVLSGAVQPVDEGHLSCFVPPLLPPPLLSTGLAARALRAAAALPLTATVFCVYCARCARRPHWQHAPSHRTTPRSSSSLLPSCRRGLPLPLPQCLSLPPPPLVMPPLLPPPPPRPHRRNQPHWALAPFRVPPAGGGSPSAPISACTTGCTRASGLTSAPLTGAGERSSGSRRRPFTPPTLTGRGAAAPRACRGVARPLGRRRRWRQRAETRSRLRQRVRRLLQRARAAGGCAPHPKWHARRGPAAHRAASARPAAA